MLEIDVLHLFRRRRPTSAARGVVGSHWGSHNVGDDGLCPDNKRDSPMEAAVFKFGKKVPLGLGREAVHPSSASDASEGNARLQMSSSTTQQWNGSPGGGNDGPKK